MVHSVDGLPDSGLVDFGDKDDIVAELVRSRESSAVSDVGDACKCGQGPIPGIDIQIRDSLGLESKACRTSSP